MKDIVLILEKKMMFLWTIQDKLLQKFFILSTQIYTSIDKIWSNQIIATQDFIWKIEKPVTHHRCRLSQIRDIKSHRLTRQDSAPSRARHRKTCAAQRKQRKGDSDAMAIPNNLRDKPCETKPTDEKARESGQIACNRNAATAFPLSPSRSFSLRSISRDVVAVSAVADLSLPATWRSTIRDARDKRSAFLPFFLLCFFSRAKSFPRRGVPRWIG